MAEYFKHAPEGESVFYSFNPQTAYQPIDRHAVARRFHALSIKTGIDFSPHSLRHYRISMWANNPRIPIAIVQKWAGHSSLAVTQKYIHIRDEEALIAAFI
jgi:integrase